jgi:hypothetical protein
MYISFKELRKSGDLLLGEKYLFYKINRFITEKKYKGLVEKNDPSWYDYFDKEYKIYYCPSIEPRFYVHFYKNNYFMALYLEVLKNRQIVGYFDVDDREFAKNPSLIKEFQIEFCKLLEI